MAVVLNFPTDFFTGPDADEPPIDGASFRAMSTLAARDREQALAAGALALLVSDWIDERFTLPEPQVPQLLGLDPETAAMTVRSEWGLGERSISNMVHLLEARGVRVFSIVEDCLKMDAYSFWRGSRPYVFLSTMKSAEHSRMDAAHELGHLTLHWRGDVHGREAEREADLFGSAFLMPRASLLASMPPSAGLQKIIGAKRHWGVSVANLAYRLHHVGLLSDWHFRMLFIEISKRGYRKDEPDPIQGEVSQLLSKVFQTLRGKGLSKADVALQVGIPIEELNRLVFGPVLLLGGERETPSGWAS
jgi:Zn-dependent peptidase ImmA (M78 family)